MATQIETEGTEEAVALTDGFHLLIDALKLNDINTIYGRLAIAVLACFSIAVMRSCLPLPAVS